MATANPVIIPRTFPDITVGTRKEKRPIPNTTHAPIKILSILLPNRVVVSSVPPMILFMTSVLEE